MHAWIADQALFSIEALAPSFNKPYPLHSAHTPSPGTESPFDAKQVKGMPVCRWFESIKNCLGAKHAILGDFSMSSGYKVV